jgi:hypothetical protein
VRCPIFTPFTPRRKLLRRWHSARACARVAPILRGQHGGQDIHQLPAQAQPDGSAASEEGAGAPSRRRPGVPRRKRPRRRQALAAYAGSAGGCRRRDGVAHPQGLGRHYGRKRRAPARQPGRFRALRNRPRLHAAHPVAADHARRGSDAKRRGAAAQSRPARLPAGHAPARRELRRRRRQNRGPAQPAKSRPSSRS